MSLLCVADHNYGTPIKTIQFHDITRNILSADQKSVKIWNRDTVRPSAFSHFTPTAICSWCCVFFFVCGGGGAKLTES